MQCIKQIFNTPPRFSDFMLQYSVLRTRTCWKLVAWWKCLQLDFTVNKSDNYVS